MLYVIEAEVKVNHGLAKVSQMAYMRYPVIIEIQRLQIFGKVLQAAHRCNDVLTKAR
jgi:SepF-like predicted cell division protein (DUF552 family)